MNHKRHKPKAGRAGCLLCKPHKAQGNSKGATKPKYQKPSRAELISKNMDDLN